MCLKVILILTLKKKQTTMYLFSMSLSHHLVMITTDLKLNVVSTLFCFILFSVVILVPMQEARPYYLSL